MHPDGAVPRDQRAEELADIKKTIENAGYYWVHQTREEFDDTRADPAKIDALFKSLVFTRIQEWLDLADERLEGKPYEMYMAPATTTGSSSTT